MLLLQTLEEAAAFVEEVGIALVHPRPGSALPSLWEEVAGPGPLEWAVRDEQGEFLAFTPEFEAVWRWKDELPERRLACVGKHLIKAVVLLAPDLVGPVYSLSGHPGRVDDFRREQLTAVQEEVAEAVFQEGPCTAAEVRRALGMRDKRRVDAAVDALQRELILTSAGSVERGRGWPAIKLDLFARHWRRWLRELLPPEQARARIAARILGANPGLTASDLAKALGWRVEQASPALGLAGDEQPGEPVRQRR